MYSESDLAGAVDAGVLSPAAAAAFRDHVAQARATPIVDEEHFRLLTGFNDIFVGIALALLIVALAQIGSSLAAPLGGLAVAIAAWPLAEFFTRRRRMALPSILLLLAFVGGIAGSLAGILVELEPDLSEQTGGLVASGIAAVAGLAAWLHWKRFAVPITVAAGAAAAVAMVTGLFFFAVPGTEEIPFPVVLAGGIAVFVLAMRWDMSDRERRTRRSDVAFWLHLVAAPLIAHPIFQMLGVFDGTIGGGTAAVVFALYLVFAFIALAIDRRALLVSSLAYVLYALYALFRDAGAVELSAAFTALVIGSALLSLSAFWQPMRRQVLSTLGGWRDRLPPARLASA